MWRTESEIYSGVQWWKVRQERERWGDREKRTKLRSEGGRYCYLRFIVITDGTTSLASNPERSYNHPPPPTSISSPLAPLAFSILRTLDYPTPTPTLLPREPSLPSRSSTSRSLSDLRRGRAAMQILLPVASPSQPLPAP